MKASNKVLIVALATLLISLAFYNLELKAEYEKGDFKKEFYSYKKLDFKDFNEIYLNAGNILDLKIVKADTFAVWLKNYDSKRFKVAQDENRLMINVADSLNSPWASSEKNIVIFCPSLIRLNLKGQTMTYYEHDTLVTTVPRLDYKQTIIEGFAQDSLMVNMGANCTLRLKKNTIKYLNSKVGDVLEKGARVIIERNNFIKKADLQIADENELSLFGPKIDEVNYTYSKGATIALSGSALSLLRK